MKTFNFLIILGIVIILKQIGFAQHFHSMQFHIFQIINMVYQIYMEI